MSLFLGVLSAAVTLNDSDYQKKLAGLENSSESTFKNIARMAGNYLTISSIVNFGRQAIQTFSDLEEATNKFDVVFQGFSGRAAAAVDELRTKFGQSELSAKQMLSGTGDILAGFGFQRDIALDLSVAAAQLGADLASFTNYAGGARGATDALTKAMLGETEMAKMLGIVIRQDSDEYKALVQQAMTTGVQIKEGGEKIIVTNEQQAKAVAALALAYQQSKNAQGDFLRSQDSIANQTQILKNNLEELYTAIGRDGANAFADALKGVNALLTGYRDLDPAIKSVINNVTLLGGAFAVLNATGIIGLAKNIAHATLALGHFIATAGSLRLQFTPMTTSVKVFGGTYQHVTTQVVGNNATMQASMTATAAAASALNIALVSVVAVLGVAYLASQAYEASLRNRAAVAADAAKKAREEYQALRQRHDLDQDRLARLQELSEIENLNNSEKEEATRLAAELNQHYQTLGVTVDQLTGSVNFCADAWARLTQEQREQRAESLNRALFAQNNAIQEQIENVLYALNSGNQRYTRVGRYTVGKISRDLSRSVTANDVEQLEMYYNAIKAIVGEHGRSAIALKDLIDMLKERTSLQQQLIGIQDIDSQNEHQAGQQAQEEANKAVEAAWKKLSQRRWEIEFDIAVPEEKIAMLRQRIEELGRESSFNSAEELLAADRSRIETTKDIALLQQIVDFQEQIRRLEQGIADERERSNDEEQRRLEQEQQRLRQRREEIERMRRDREFSGLSDDEKIVQLHKDAYSLFMQINRGRFKNIAEFMAQDINGMNEEDLQIYQHILRLSYQRLDVERRIARQREDDAQRAMDDAERAIQEEEQRERERQEQEQQAWQRATEQSKRYLDYQQERERSRIAREKDLTIDRLDRGGQSAAATAFIQREFERSQRLAMQAQRAYERFFRTASADGLTEVEQHNLQEMFATMQRLFNDVDQWQQRVDSRSADNPEQGQKSVREAVGAWSLAELRRISGDSPEMQTARNTKETSRQVRQIAETVKKGGILTW